MAKFVSPSPAPPTVAIACLTAPQLNSILVAHTYTLIHSCMIHICLVFPVTNSKHPFLPRTRSLSTQAAILSLINVANGRTNMSADTHTVIHLVVCMCLYCPVLCSRIAVGKTMLAASIGIYSFCTPITVVCCCWSFLLAANIFCKIYAKYYYS